MAPQGRGPICYIFMLSQMWAGATNCGPFSQGDGGVWIINTTLNYILNACNRFWGCGGGKNDCTACVQYPALMLGADDARMSLGEARSTNPSSNPLGDILGRDWCHRGGKRSCYNVNSSSCTCNRIFVDCLVQDAYGNVAIRILTLLASPQHMYINQIGRR